MGSPSDRRHLPTAGPKPGLAESEIITLLLVLHSSGFKYLKNFYNSPMSEVLCRYFPQMPFMSVL